MAVAGVELRGRVQIGRGFGGKSSARARTMASQFIRRRLRQRTRAAWLPSLLGQFFKRFFCALVASPAQLAHVADFPFCGVLQEFHFYVAHDVAIETELETLRDAAYL